MKIHLLPTSSWRKNRSRRAFTVIELMVAAAITIVLAGLMITVVVNVLNGWNRSHGAITTESAARLVLDQLSSDLSSAVIRRDGGVWLAASAVDNNNTVSGWIDGVQNSKPSSLDASATRAELADESSLENSRFGKAGVWLRLITAAPTKHRKASEPVAPVAVSYQLIRRRPNPANVDSAAHYILFRTEVSPTDTFAGGYNLTPGSEPAYLTTLTSPDAEDIIADNVIDLGVWFYSRDTNGSLVRVYPLDSAGSYVGFPNATLQVPIAADVMIRVLTPEGARLLAAFEDGLLTTGNWWDIAETNSRVFTRRVQIQSSPL